MITVFGIPNCDSLKKARKWLEAQDINFEFHDFRKQGLEASQVDNWLAKVERSVLVNKRSTTWKQLSDEEKQQAESDSVTELLLRHPTLIKRPVIQTDDQVLVGYNESQLQTLK